MKDKRRGSGEKKKSLRSRLGKPMFTDQHWLHGHQAWRSEKLEEEEGREE